jgi:hypothetical protein
MQLGLDTGEAIPRLPLEPYQKLTELRLCTLRKIDQGRVVKNQEVSVSGANLELSIVNHFAHYYSYPDRAGSVVYIKLKTMSACGTYCSFVVACTGLTHGLCRL